MGMRGGGRDSFVVVSYDFEYSTEEGKRVWMKEGEVLLLLAKTNNDWWQVIRRGDRRPFYAPARYVAELGAESGEWDAAFTGDVVHYRPDNGEPLPSRIPVDSFQDKKSHFSTFLGNNSNKRASYAPPSSVQGPQSSDFLFGAPRFQERYRSNSMDSILVADMNRHIFRDYSNTKPTAAPLAARHQAGPLPQPFLIGGHHPHPAALLAHHHQQQPQQLGLPAGGGLEKRPTFDNIDKRSSWSHDPHSANLTTAPAQFHTRNYPVYPPGGGQVGVPLSGNKKPVPLPRSKIPTPVKAASLESGPIPPDLRAFKRSKTDLSLGMLQSYKTGRAVQSAPKELAAVTRNKPNHHQTAATAQVRRPSTNRSGSRPAVIREESHDLRAPMPFSASTFSVSSGREPLLDSGSEPLVIREKTRTPAGRFEQLELTAGRQAVVDRLTERSDRTGGGGGGGGGGGAGLRQERTERRGEADKNSYHSRPSRTSESEQSVGNSGSKPVVKEKPALIKTTAAASQHHPPDKSDTSAPSGRKPNQILRIQSESDLLARQLAEQQSALLRHTDSEEEEELKISLRVEGFQPAAPLVLGSNSEVTGGSGGKRSESKENLNPQKRSGGVRSSGKKFRPRNETNEKFLDMEPLPEPPPTPPLGSDGGGERQSNSGTGHSPPPSTSPIPIPTENQVSQPLIISTEPMSASSNSGINNRSTEEKSNFSSSFDSLDGSLGSAGWPEGGDWLGSEPHRDQVKSPNTSTCSRTPASPIPGSVPVRHVMTDWDEFLDTSGRKYYYNAKTHEKSWKPPRNSKGRGSSEGYSAPTSPDLYNEQNVDSAFEMSPGGLSEVDTRSIEDEPTTDEDVIKQEAKEEREKEGDKEPEKESSQIVPSGYEIKNHSDSGEQYFVNVFTGVAWYSAQDRNGRTYYYEENGNESCWQLPNVAQTIQDHSVNPSPVPPEADRSSLPAHGRPREGSRDRDSGAVTAHQQQQSLTSIDAATVDSKTESLRQKFYTTSLSTVSTTSLNFTIGDVSIVVVKQGPLYKTKLEERGKKYRKNWCLSNVVLTDTFLLFYKDSKSFASLQAGGANKPDHCIDLKGAQIEWCNSDKSKRSNVFEILTVLDQKMLLQDDDFSVANDWFSLIEQVIVTLSQRELVGRNSMPARSIPTTGEPVDNPDSASSTLQSKKSKVGRTKSLKLKLLTSNEELADLPTPSTPDSPQTAMPFVKEKSRIREKLRKFFLRRPAVDELMKRGIMKNEPVFGSTLHLLAKADHSDVPLFVKKCIAIIESRVEYLSTDGVYRQSGNLSVVQRLRLQVDHGNTAVLETVDDVHVLTGALKLFFRELKEPLIPWECVDRLIAVCNLPSKKAKIKGLKEILCRLPSPHQATLLALLRHLDKVTQYKEVNRMAVSNLAIVFGPTLMWPPAHLTNTNMALNMMQQNMIVEALITHLSQIA